MQPLSARLGVLVLVSSAALLGCESGKRAQYPQQPWPPPASWSQPAGPPVPDPYGSWHHPPGTAAPATLLGNAVTAFGVLVRQMPALSPAPGSGGSQGAVLGWPVPWLTGPVAPGTSPYPVPAQPAPPQGPTPQPAPVPVEIGGSAQWIAFEEEVLSRTNQLRAEGVHCGGQELAPAAPLVTHPALRASARAHSSDMALRDYFAHVTPDGVEPARRATAAGYSSTLVGENIAAGQTTPASVLAAWIKSPGHCVNLMDPRYRFLGVGYFFEEGGDQFGHYWTQNFGG